MRKSYHDIKAHVMERIRRDDWSPGTHLPGEVALAEEFGCARATVNRAMRELAAEGVLERKRKAGTRVRPVLKRKAEFQFAHIRDEIEAAGETYRYVLVDQERVAAPGWLRALMEIPKGRPVLHICAMHYAGTRAFQLEDRWFNIDAMPPAAHTCFAANIPDQWLSQNVPFADEDVVLFASNATQQVADYLNMSPGDAVFVVDRTAMMDGRKLSYARVFHHRDYRMTSSL